MNSIWQDFLGTFGAHIDNGMVTDFGDSSGEFVSARDATVITPLTHLGLIECAGDDAQTFLHAQLTSDVKKLSADAAQYSAWCTAKGRMLASFILYRREAGYQALLSSDLLADTIKRLQIYVLRSKVKITDLSSEHEIIGLSGQQSVVALQSAELPAPSGIMERAAFAHGTVIRLDATRFVIVTNRAVAEDIWKKLAANARPVGTPVWHWLDIQAGIPLITLATKESFVPQMTNLDKIGGLSFNKGCYPGQEIVARTHYLGKIKRHLYRIHSDVLMQAGESLYSADSPEAACGTIANVAPEPAGGFVALGVIQENQVEAGNIRLGKPDGSTVFIEPVAY